jgi:hypothetical protein
MLDIGLRVVSVDMNIHDVGAGLLCYGHAERIVVPRGWTLVDEREHSPRLFDVGQPTRRLPPSTSATTARGPFDVEREDGSGVGADRADSPDSADDTPDSERKPRREKRRRRIFTELENRSDPNGADPNGAGGTADRDGQLSFGAYDLPGAYQDLADRRTEHASARVDVNANLEDSEDSEDREDAAEPDQRTSPLLARAFDLSKSRRVPSPLDQHQQPE